MEHSLCCGRALKLSQRVLLLCFTVVLVAVTLPFVSGVTANETEHLQRRLGAIDATGDGPRWLYASSAPSLYRSYDQAPRLHFAVMCLPLWGHFQAVHAVAEELAHRGHHITYFVENPKWCDAVQGSHEKKRSPNWDVDCIFVNTSVAAGVSSQPLFTPSFFAKISKYSSFLRSFDDLMKQLFRHHADTLPTYLNAVGEVQQMEPITTFLCDLTTFACPSVARYFDVSVVNVFPFTLQMAVGLHTELPAMGTALPREMSLWQRTKNFGTKLATYALSSFTVSRLNDVRDRLGIPPYQDAFDVAGLYDTVLVPGLWGLDIAQPLCPNVHPVGGLLTRADRAASSRDLTDEGLLSFLDRCEQGTIYVNFGTLALLTGPMMRKLEAAFREMPFCVVWKMPLADASQNTPTVTVESDQQFFVRPWFSVPMGIMRHPNVFVFVSHCGDASVMEAIDAGLPILGLPMFADQGDVCQRIGEAGVGVCLRGGKHAFTPRDVTAAVWDIARRNSDYAANLQRLQAVSKVLGGPARAADIIETRQYNLFLRRGDSMEVCTALTAGVWAATGIGKVFFLLFLSTVLWLVVLLLGGRVWHSLMNPDRLRLWLAFAWQRRREQKTEQPIGSQLRVVPRRHWHDDVKRD